MLVILGLLTGGVLAGQSLIRAAELRSISADYARYTAAVNSFRDKYMALPGDMTNATAFWGIAGGTTGNDASCYNVASMGGTATCNGNGNGRWYLDDGVSNQSAPEWFRAWQHLANAGLVEGSYSGVAAATPRMAQPGKNVPKARIGNVGFTLMSAMASATDPNWWSGNYDGFAVGGVTGNVESSSIFLKPEEAWNIDQKSDDGIPNQGNVRDYRGHTSCHTGSAGNYSYNLKGSTNACGLFMAINPPGGGQ